MKKVMSLLFMCVIALTFCACGEKHDFRNVDFGMTKQEVRKAEKDSELLNSGDTYLMYNITINTFPCEVQYQFDENDCLSSINGYCYVSESEELIKEFEKFKEYFDDICGEPYINKEDTVLYDNCRLKLYDSESNDKKYISFFVRKTTI